MTFANSPAASAPSSHGKRAILVGVFLALGALIGMVNLSNLSASQLEKMSTKSMDMGTAAVSLNSTEKFPIAVAAIAIGVVLPATGVVVYDSTFAAVVAHKVMKKKRSDALAGVFPDGPFALIGGHNGKLCSAHDSGIVCTADKIGDAEKFVSADMFAMRIPMQLWSLIQSMCLADHQTRRLWRPQGRPQGWCRAKSLPGLRRFN